MFIMCIMFMCVYIYIYIHIHVYTHVLHGSSCPWSGCGPAQIN